MKIKLNTMDLLKKGLYMMALLCFAFVTSCDDDDVDFEEIKGLDFVIATLNFEGNEVGVVPTTVNSNNRIIYTVDFGATPDVDTDVLATSGPMVIYEYPDEDATYTITVTAQLQGAADVSISKEHTVTINELPTLPPSGGNPLVGRWKLAPTAGAIGVGPGQGNVGWWSNAEEDVTTRDCLFDDEYVFMEDGTFQNILGSETWLEPWQGTDPEACGSPVFPHDGSAVATYEYNELTSQITLDGTGAFLGLAKVFNGGELGSPGDAVDSITYEVTFSNCNNEMQLDIQIDPANDGWWTFKLVKVESNPCIFGTWKLAPEAGAIGVGPGRDNVGWWSNAEEDVTTRDCLFDDEYVFNEDGTFQNILGSETWLEPWQGTDPEACGTPVFPHDGSASATYEFNEITGQITIEGTGAFLGLAKVVNGAEIGSPGDAPESVTYEAIITGNVMELDIQIDSANDGWWSFKLVRQ